MVVEFTDDPAEIEARILRGRGALLFVGTTRGTPNGRRCSVG
jgi:hypothetical protein